MKLENWMVERMLEWRDQAAAAGETEPSAMSLATLRPDGSPMARTVLFKHIDTQGPVFYTNTQSDKGREIAADNRVCLCLLWKAVYRQVIIEGHATPVADGEADAYWVTRPRGSQIGGWASQQSRPLASREVLESNVAEVQTRYAGGDIPRPPHWSGYRVDVQQIEFWYGRESRLHDRFRYTVRGESWQEQRLNP